MIEIIKAVFSTTIVDNLVPVAAQLWHIPADRSIQVLLMFLNRLVQSLSLARATAFRHVTYMGSCSLLQNDFEPDQGKAVDVTETS